MGGSTSIDAILVSAAAKELPVALVGQLVVGGRMVLPLTGDEGQQALTAVERTAVDAVTVAEVIPVQFTALETLL
jgi:protein-L-isoaspartate(D-aspartate) O-methyltransferase